MMKKETTRDSVIARLAVLIFLLNSWSTTFAQNEDHSTRGWPMFRGNPQLTGAVKGNLPDNPQVVWRFQADDVIESTAAIHDGTVFVGSLDGFLYAVDFATGRLKWKTKASDEIKSSPLIYRGCVYFGDSSGKFSALNAQSGEIIWSFQTDGEIISSANVHDARVLFGSYDNFLYCLAAEDGKLLWKLESEGYIHATPAVVGGDAYVTGCDYFFRIVDIASGQQRAAIDLGNYVAASPAVVGQRAFFGTFGNQVICLDIAKKVILWKYEHPKRKFPYYASAAISEAVVVVGGRDKMLHALNRDTGKEIWSFMTRAKIDASPVIVGGKVLSASSRGTVHLFDLHTGDLLWQYDSGASIAASPSYAGGKFIIGNDDGVLICFGEKKEKL